MTRTRLQMLASEFIRIDPGLLGQFIHETLVIETLLRAVDRAPRAILLIGLVCDLPARHSRDRVDETGLAFGRLALHIVVLPACNFPAWTKRRPQVA